jgi:hypothetical protein
VWPSPGGQRPRSALWLGHQAPGLHLRKDLAVILCYLRGGLSFKHLNDIPFQGRAPGFIQKTEDQRYSYPETVHRALPLGEIAFLGHRDLPFFGQAKSPEAVCMHGRTTLLESAREVVPAPATRSCIGCAGLRLAHRTGSAAHAVRRVSRRRWAYPRGAMMGRVSAGRLSSASVMGPG